MLLLLFPPVFLATFRYNVGTDYNSYIRLYNILKNYDFYQYIVIWTKDFTAQELSWYLLNRVAFLVFNNEISIFFLSSFIMMIFIFKGIDYYVKDISIGYAFFVFFMIHYNMSFNAIRTFLAASIIFYSYKFIIEKNFVKYILFIILASTFHKSAFVALLFYAIVPMNDKQLNKFKKVLYYMLILSTPLVLVILLKIAQFIPIFQKYFYKYSINYYGGGIGFLIFILPFLLPIIIFKKSIVEINEKYNVLVDVSLLHIPLRYVGYFTEYGHRLEVYPSMVYIILISLLVNNIHKPINRLFLKTYYTMILLFYYIYIYIIKLGHGTYPYYFINNL